MFKFWGLGPEKSGCLKLIRLDIKAIISVYQLSIEAADRNYQRIVFDCLLYQSNYKLLMKFLQLIRILMCD